MFGDSVDKELWDHTHWEREIDPFNHITSIEQIWSLTVLDNIDKYFIFKVHFHTKFFTWYVKVILPLVQRGLQFIMEEVGLNLNSLSRGCGIVR